MKKALRTAVAAALLGIPHLALAQEATSTPSPTQPAAGHFAARQTMRYLHMGTDPASEERDGHMLISETRLTYGVLGNLALTLDVPVVTFDQRTLPGGERDTDSGLADLSIGFKHRIWQLDSGPLDTQRISLLGAVELPTGTGPYTTDSVDPSFGAVYMGIFDRFGITQALRYKFNTAGEGRPTRLSGDSFSDALRHDTAALYRLSPAQYSATTEAATYVMLELNGLYEINGDYELLWAPGFLYEATTFAVEVSLILPVYEAASHRAPTEFGIALGLRLLF